MGLLSLLDEESKFPRSTDHSLAGEFGRESGEGERGEEGNREGKGSWLVCLGEMEGLV